VTGAPHSTVPAGVFQILNELQRGMYLRRFAPIASVCTVLLFATLAHSQQQIDIAVGGGTTLAFKNTTASEALLPPQEKGGTYPSVSADVRLKKRYGLNVETSWKYKKANYDGYETYRPIFTDVNALYQPQLRKKIGLDLMAGVGIDTNRFYLPGINCGSIAGTCFVSSDHFMEHLSGGVRYYFWHHLPNFFVRPEIHYYHIQNNFEFHSDSVFRAAVSIGYTWGSH
jgi:hypothetical protein